MLALGWAYYTPDIAVAFFQARDQGFSVFGYGEALFSSGFFYRELDLGSEVAALG